ncbi:MAG: CHAT domain-containing protein [Gammaproteobacteria bacterium]
MKRIKNLLLCAAWAICTANAAGKPAQLAAQSREALQQGRYTQADTLLHQLAAQADTAQDAYWQTWTRAMQGYLALQRRQYETAEPLLNDALAAAESAAWTGLAVRTRLYRGQLRQNTGRWPQADEDYANAVQAAAALFPDLTASALLHRAGLAQQRLAYREAAKLLPAVQALLRLLPEGNVKARLTLDLGYRYLQLLQADSTAVPLEDTYAGLHNALEQARKLRLSRQSAQALGYLSDLYRLEGRTAEVAPLLQQAIFYAQQSDARDVLLRLEWRLGRYYAGAGRQDAAIGAYRRTVAYIQATRQDIPVTYENGRSSFRDTLAPAYLELAELLFAKAAKSPDTQRQALLQEAQTTVELIKKSELEDYFQSRCELPSRPLAADALPPGVAVLYPVIFPQHVDMLLLTRDGLQHFSRPIAQSELQAGIRELAGHLRNYDDRYPAQARKLYDLLIRPAANLLHAQRIDKLIYIPDGPLRLIPLSALYDGAHYVLEDYAVTVSPGLSVAAAHGITQSADNILLAGLSEPGEVVKELPENLLQGLLLTSSSPQTRRGAFARAFSRDASGLHGAELRALLDDSSVIRKLQQNLQLPSVAAEIDGLSKQWKQSRQLMNETFTLQNFSDELHDRSYRIVHIASHGFFGGTEQNSFIMTYDRILDMKRFDALLNSGSNRRRSPDLITLSACHTAEGDDRSPLGISGVAIKAKVKNVLGSLWPVSDAATARLMEHFYRNLLIGLSKAEALRQAQLTLLKSKNFAAAPFWAPFILVGSAW